MTSKLMESLIVKVTKSAYKNVYEWMSSDPNIASQLRDGIRTVISAFDEIDTSIDDAAIVLEEMQKKLQRTLEFYRQMPGDDGTWECSALNIINREIEVQLEILIAKS